MRRDLKDRGFEVLALDWKDSKEIQLATRERMKLGFPFLKVKPEVKKAYVAEGGPTNYLIGRDGKVAWAMTGFGAGLEKLLREQVEKALE